MRKFVLVFLAIFCTRSSGLECLWCFTYGDAKGEAEICRNGSSTLIPKINDPLTRSCWMGINYRNDSDPKIGRSSYALAWKGCTPTIDDFGPLLYECQVSGRIRKNVKMLGHNNEEIPGDARDFGPFCEWNLANYTFYCPSRGKLSWTVGNIKPLTLPAECGDEWKKKERMSMNCYCATDNCNSF